MIIEIDTKLLQEEDLTPDEYIYLWHLYNKMEPNIPIDPNYEKLEDEGYITDKVDITDKGYKLFQNPDWEERFLEFWNKFPYEVRRPQGNMQTLRTEGTKTKWFKDARAKYKKVNKQHDLIMRGLEIELKNPTYMHNILTWLNRKRWEILLKSDKIVTESKLHKDI